MPEDVGHGGGAPAESQRLRGTSLRIFKQLTKRRIAARQAAVSQSCSETMRHLAFCRSLDAIGSWAGVQNDGWFRCLSAAQCLFNASQAALDVALVAGFRRCAQASLRHHAGVAGERLMVLCNTGMLSEPGERLSKVDDHCRVTCSGLADLVEGCIGEARIGRHLPYDTDLPSIITQHPCGEPPVSEPR